MNAKLNVIIVAHKFLPQPDDDLILFLNQNKFNNILQINHDFSDAPSRISNCKWFSEGELRAQWKSSDTINLPEFVTYTKEFIFAITCVLKTKLIWDVSINMDGLCTMMSLFARSIGRIKKVVFWAMDFVPEKRFSEGLKNLIYEKINTFCYKKADEMWDISPRMAEAREKFLGFTQDGYQKHFVVPYGMWINRIVRYSYEQCEKNTLVFMGHLIEKQGVQLVLNAMPEIIRQIPDFHFKVIGTGNYENELKKIVENLNIQRHVGFLGKIDKNEDLEIEVAKSCVAIAPYIKHLDTWTKYADPGKIKTYLACGVPILLTDISWNAHEIQDKSCGMLIEENTLDLVSKLVKLMDSSTNQLYRKNVVEYANSFDYTNIFNNLKLLK